MKYMGSKQRFAKELLQIILADRQNGQAYVEPFVGGFNMICNVPSEHGPRYANDSNKYVVALFKALVAGWEPPLDVTREQYANVKTNMFDYPDYIVGYIGFCCSYSGKWFGGYAGKTNTAIGTVRDYQDESLRNIKKQCENLKDVWFNDKSYQDLIFPDNSIIYCDPPYEGTTGYKDAFDSNLFWDWVRTQHNKGHSVFVSEYKAPLDFECIWEKEAKSSLSANGDIGGNKVSVERLFRIA